MNLVKGKNNNVLIVCANHENHETLVKDWWLDTMNEHSYETIEQMQADKRETSNIENLCRKYDVVVEFEEWTNEDWEAAICDGEEISYCDYNPEGKLLVICENFEEKYINFIEKSGYSYFELIAKTDDDELEFLNKLETEIANWIPGI